MTIHVETVAQMLLKAARARAELTIRGHDVRELLKLEEPRLLARGEGPNGPRLLVLLAIDEALLQVARAGAFHAVRALTVGPWLDPAPAPVQRRASQHRRRLRARSRGATKVRGMAKLGAAKARRG
jgi:hypothetical protein